MLKTKEDMNNIQQAFPVIGDIERIHDGGMTLLDYFAGQALTGILAKTEYQSYRRDDLAKAAYTMGKEMMELKLKGQELLDKDK